ncbi:MAG: hypothetical protein K2O18_15645 [Oscillospiraceae bacterium]|nr:hypothetical protein [Oscillospiraceae bacterium]
MKRLWRTAVLFLAMAVMLAETAFANSAAPDYLQVVRLKNAPEKPYYLDLLAEGTADSSCKPAPGSPEDQELLAALRKAVPEGWKACTLSWTNSFHVEGDLEGENGIHRFSGFHTPEKFRILAVTQSGETWVSDVMERRTVQDSVMVDWDTKTVSSVPVGLAVALQALSTLLPTLLLESLLLLAFGFSWKKNWKPFLLVNLVTQGALTLFISTSVLQSGGSEYMVMWYGIFLVPVELLIAFVEAYVYFRWFTGHTGRRAFAYGIAANAVSYLLGLWIVPAVWESFVRVLWLGV